MAREATVQVREYFGTWYVRMVLLETNEAGASESDPIVLEKWVSDLDADDGSVAVAVLAVRTAMTPEQWFQSGRPSGLDRA